MVRISVTCWLWWAIGYRDHISFTTLACCFHVQVCPLRMMLEHCVFLLFQVCNNKICQNVLDFMRSVSSFSSLIEREIDETEVPNRIHFVYDKQFEIIDRSQ
mgnify:CR=1 FL=1